MFEFFKRDEPTQCSSGRREKGLINPIVQRVETQNLTRESVGEISRSTVGETGENRCGKHEISNIPSDLVGSSGQNWEVFHHLDPLLRHLWHRETSSRASYCGGWLTTVQRGEVCKSGGTGYWQQWPRIGSGGGEKTWAGTSSGDPRSFREVCEVHAQELTMAGGDEQGGALGDDSTEREEGGPHSAS